MSTKETTTLSRFLENLQDKITLGFVKSLKEHTAIAVALIIFFAFPYAIRVIDPTAGSYDAGVLQIIVTAIVMLTVFQWATWQIIKGLWPGLHQYAENMFNHDYKDSSKWEKLKVFLFVYFSILLSLVMLSRVIS